MKKCIIAVIGGTVVLFGAILLVLPGPGVLVIAGGLAILATEFLWAKRALRNAKGAVAKARRKGGWLAWMRRRRSSAMKPSP
jgi:uncharacterized protein (TIGR02611 family)